MCQEYNVISNTAVLMAARPMTWAQRRQCRMDNSSVQGILPIIHCISLFRTLHAIVKVLYSGVGEGGERGSCYDIWFASYVDTLEIGRQGLTASLYGRHSLPCRLFPPFNQSPFFFTQQIHSRWSNTIRKTLARWKLSIQLVLFIFPRSSVLRRVFHWERYGSFQWRRMAHLKKAFDNRQWWCVKCVVIWKYHHEFF